MYFHGLSRDKVFLKSDGDLNSERERVESYIETSKQKPVVMVTLFGRQVFSVQSECFQSADEQSRRFLKKDIDLCRPADPYIYNLHRSDEHGRFGSLGCSRDTAEVELSSGLESMAKEASTTNCPGKRNPRTVIDLEEPPSWVSKEKTGTSASASCVASGSYIGRNLESKPSVLSGQSISKTLEADQSLVADDRSCEKRGFSDEGHRSGNTKETTNSTPSSKQSFISCAPGLLDLNETPVDEPCSDRDHYFLQDLNYPYTHDTTLSSEKSGVEDPTPFCSPCSQNVVDKDGTASPASYTSCCTTENNSRIKSRSSSPPTPVPSCRTQLEYPETEALPGERKSECCNEEDSSEMSLFIQMAAESLVQISCTSLYQHQDLSSDPVSRSNSSSQDRDLSFKPELGNVEPECSLDSYELLTLELTETSPEDYCVSSKVEDDLNITGENKELGLRLRRGRRMKNFQKEVLPGLVSLSRHEIREDINILEAVLRSREYKKMQGKTGDDKCGANPRKRRSGQRYVGRRRRRSE